MDIFVENHTLVQQDHDYRYLVLSGSGLKGLVGTGILLALEEAGILYDDHNQFKLKGLAGTSFSSFIIALLGVGYTPREIQRIIIRLDTGNLRDRKVSRLGLIFKKGAHKGTYLYNLLGSLIEVKTGNSEETLYHLYKRTGVRLVIMTTDLIHKKSVALDPLNEYGSLPIRKAVQMSMALPFLFEPISYGSSLFVDGSLLNSYPINVFDSDGPNPYVLGLRVMASDETPLEVQSLLQYGMALVQLYEETNPIVMSQYDMMRTLTILTKNYPLTQLKLSRVEKLELMTVGIETIENYFAV